MQNFDLIFDADQGSPPDQDRQHGDIGRLTGVKNGNVLCSDQRCQQQPKVARCGWREGRQP
jgi:hypothetical protein